MSEKTSDLPFESPLVPNLLDLGDNIQFNCHKNISCFNACCKQADITLTPYDVIRLKTHLGMSSSEFLKKHTVPFEMDASGMPGIKMRTQDKDPACLLLNEEGCSVYEDRPSSCRYYPVGLMTMRKKDVNHEEHHYCLVEENHCMGHKEDRKITIADYRKEQKVEIFDDMNREWYQIILKKRSSGPGIGNPSDTSFHFFFMCSYDIDRFREFVMADNFKNTYNLHTDTWASIKEDDTALLQFSFALMKQVLFGENSIALHSGAAEERIEKRKDILDARRQAEVTIHQQKADVYNMSEDNG
jgi:uncharacterized protein